MGYKTEQETFWRGEFGDRYAERNACTEQFLASSVNFFSKILSRTAGIESMIEFGANVGINLKAIKTLLPGIREAAIEINRKAASKLREDTFFGGKLEVFEESILDFQPKQAYDLALVAGVLIHISPDELEHVYEKLHASARKYVCISEYYNPTPVEVTYRGHAGRLFKRDFAGEFLDRYSDYRLLDYGFQYHRDLNFPKDDTTWFLLEKKS